ncbi:MAG: hypothetical protein ACR2LL_11355 [Nitrosopumilus sp.]
MTEALQPRGENPFMTVLDNNQEFSVTQNEIIRLIGKKTVSTIRDISGAFKVGYEIDIQDPIIFDQKKKKLIPVNEDEEDTNNVTTSFLISSQLPFPLSGESYNPVYVIQPQKEFEFELLVFQTKNKNIDFEKSVIDESIEEDTDLPVTEIGTIELTFPQDDDIISEEDEIKSIPEEDKIIGDIPDDDKEIIPDDDKVIPEDNVIDIVSDNDIESNDNKIDYTNMIGFVTLLVVMVAAYAFFKKLKDEKIKMKSVKKL